MAFNPKIKFTVRDYMATPEDKRYELIDGELLVTPSPSYSHQTTVLRLARWLSEYVDAKGLGVVVIAPMDVILSEHDVLQPDVLFVSNERASIISDRIRGAPDLVIEVLSPSSEERDRVLKRTIYARYGVREYWLVDPEARQVEVLTLGEEGLTTAGTYGRAESLSSSLLRGLVLPLDQLWGQDK